MLDGVGTRPKAMCSVDGESAATGMGKVRASLALDGLP